MQVGMIGLGRMGANMVERLLRAKHQVFAFDKNSEATKSVQIKGATGAASLEELLQNLPAPRVLWLMVPSGGPVTQTINELLPLIASGDIVVDGGNSHYTDSMRRAADLEKMGIHFLDVGTSGGVWGLQAGYCLMIGGQQGAFNRAEPLFKSLAPDDGYAHVGPSGAGHFVKMIHNGIEYGLMQAYGEGFELLKASEFKVDLAAIAALWNHGSVVRSWLLELVASALRKDPELGAVRDYVEDTGEGRWTVQEALERNIPTPVIMLSLLARVRSRQQESFSGKVVAALRKEFGGHPVKTKEA